MTKVNLERWRAHLEAARVQGVSLARYAREHGLLRHTLYAAQRQAQSEQRPNRTRSAAVVAGAAPFVRVELASSPTGLRARLPNGVELEFGHVEPSACAALIGMLATLPCSG